jgi:Nuclear condensing complex subunits, C-term domain
MVKMYAEQDATEFANTLMECTARLLVVGKREKSVENCIKFVARFVVLPDVAEVLAPFMLQWLMSLSECADKSVRFRACQLTALILNALADDIDFEIDEEVFGGVYARVKDRVPSVREQAVEGLYRLQEPQNAECEAVDAMLRLLASDSSTSVRKAALSHIALSKKTLPAVLDRTRDVVPAIRSAAFSVLERKLFIRSLSIAQRCALVREGLRDRDDKVQQACQQMIIRNWLHNCDNDVRQLLVLLNVEGSELSCELLVRRLFANDIMPHSQSFICQSIDAIRQLVVRDQQRQRRLEDLRRQSAAAANSSALLNSTGFGFDNDNNENGDTPSKRVNSSLTAGDNDDDDDDDERAAQIAVLEEERERDANGALLIDAESALLWRLWCEHAAQRADDELLDDLLPSAPELRMVLLHAQANPFVAKQLFLIMHFVVQATDSCGRGMMSTTVTEFLQSDETDADAVPILMKRLHELHPSVGAFRQEALQVLSNVRDSLELIESEEMQAMFLNIDEEADQVRAQLHEARRQLRIYYNSSSDEEHESDDDGDNDNDERRQLRAKVAQLNDEMALIETRKELRDNLELFIHLRSLAIVEELLGFTPPTAVRDAPIARLVSTILHPTVLHPLPTVRNCATRCLGVYCMLDRGEARTHMRFFLRIVRDEQPGDTALYITALQVIFDLVMLHQLPTFLEPDAATLFGRNDDDGCAAADWAHLNRAALVQVGEESAHVTHRDITAPMATCLRSRDETLRTTAVEGFARLFYCGMLADDHQALGVVIVQYFSPLTEDDVRFRQCVSVFLQAFAHRSAANRAMLIDAFVVAIRAVHKAQRKSQLRRVNVHEMARLVISLTLETTDQLAERGDDALGCHDRLALAFIKIVLRLPYFDERNQPLCRALRYLHQLARTNRRHIKTLATLVPHLLPLVKDATSRTSINIFKRAIDQADNDDIDNDIELSELDIDRIKAEYIRGYKRQFESDDEEEEGQSGDE